MAFMLTDLNFGTVTYSIPNEKISRRKANVLKKIQSTYELFLGINEHFSDWNKLFNYSSTDGLRYWTTW